MELTPEAAQVLRAQQSARLDAGADRCMEIVEHGGTPAPARLAWFRGVEGEQLRLEVLWDPEVGLAFERLTASEGTRAVPLDPWAAEELDAFIARHDVEVTGRALEVLEQLRAEHRQAAGAVRRSRATASEPIEPAASALGGELAPFQWAAVDYALRARRAFLADEQGLGKTVEALAALEADGAYPAIVVCPASMKLNWERETQRWLPHRSVAVIHGRLAVPPRGDITILNYEIVAAHRQALSRPRARAIVIDESHYCKNPSAKRTQAVRAVAASVVPDGLRLALTGTPVLNHADELIAQLRVIDRLTDFGSGARFSAQFRGRLSEERLHWHLRRHCFVRRLKADVLPQLPAKRQVVVPMALTNDSEYRLAERDVIAWLRTQPLDLSTLNAKIASTLRAQRLAQLGTLQRLAARGKLAAALAWIGDFLASGEALVVFARHVEVQHAVIERFPDALHLLGEDSMGAREAAIASFQHTGGPPLIVAATRPGITYRPPTPGGPPPGRPTGQPPTAAAGRRRDPDEALIRQARHRAATDGRTVGRRRGARRQAVRHLRAAASNVAFLELEWTPAMHDQAEDRCHRIGQHDAVTAWYLLAATTIDETMARLIQSKRATVAAVTDGRTLESGGLVEAVVRELRDGKPFAHLRAVS